MERYRPVTKVAYGFGSAGIVAAVLALYQAIETGEWYTFINIFVPVIIPVVIGFVVAWFKIDPERERYLKLIRDSIKEVNQGD